MTTLARLWKCPRCGWRYESPIAVMGVGCPHHARTVAMKPDDGEGEA